MKSTRTKYDRSTAALEDRCTMGTRVDPLYTNTQTEIAIATSMFCAHVSVERVEKSMTVSSQQIVAGPPIHPANIIDRVEEQEERRKQQKKKKKLIVVVMWIISRSAAKIVKSSFGYNT